MTVFRHSKKFSTEESYLLTDQIRRSSRSVSTNLAEAHFLSKLTDSYGENIETATWLFFARDCGYLDDTTHAQMLAENRPVGAMLGAMIKNYRSFCIYPSHRLTD